MKFARLTSRVVAGGATAALATAALVGVTATTASAASFSTSYTCAVPTLGDRQFPLSVDFAALPPTATAGTPIAAGSLPFTSKITVPADAEGLLEFVQATGGRSDDFGVSIGDATAPAPVKWDTKTPAVNPGDPTVYSGKGANAAFTLPKAGSFAIKMPAKFTLTATKADGSVAGTLSCASAAPTQVSSIVLSKQVAKVKAQAAPKSSKVGDIVTVKGKVSNEFAKKGGPAATGKLVVKDGSKTVAKGKVTKKGKFKIKVQGLKAGSHTLVVTYKGDDYTDKAKSAKLKVTVKA